MFGFCHSVFFLCFCLLYSSICFFFACAPSLLAVLVSARQVLFRDLREYSLFDIFWRSIYVPFLLSVYYIVDLV